MAACPHCGEAFELVGRTEAAERLGVSVNTFDSWRSGRRRAEPGLPDPVAEVSGYAPVWLWSDLEAWAAERVSG